MALAYGRTAEVPVGNVAATARDDNLTGKYLRHVVESGVTANELTAAADASQLLTTAYRGSGRFLSRPAFLSVPDRQQLESDLIRLHTLLTRLPERLFGGRLDEFCRAAGMTPAQADIAYRTMTPAGAPTRLARADLYHDGAGFRLLEYNVTSALGGFDIAELARALLAAPALSEFAADHDLDFPDTLAKFADTIRAAAAASGRDLADRPVIALADWPASYPDLERRLKYMAGALHAYGFDAMPCHVGQLDYRSGGVYLDGRRIDIVYRFFLIEDLLDADGIPELLEPLIKAHETGRVFLFAGLDSEMYGNKRALGLLSDEQHRDAFTTAERTLVDRLLPWTRPLRPSDVEFGGQHGDLLDLVRARRADFILKPSLLHGGIGVLPGWRVTSAEWAAALDAATDGPFVVQQRVQPVGQPFLMPNAALADVYLNWGVFVGEGGYAGAILRGSTDPDIGVLSMAGGAKVTACLHQASRECPSMDPGGSPS